MGFCSSVSRLLLFIFNLLFVISAVALITIGALIINGVDDFQSSHANDALALLKAPPIFLIVLGSVVFIIAFFGCCGAIRDSLCMLNVYAAILFLAFLTQMILSIFVLVKWQNPKDAVNDTLLQIFKENTQESGQFFDTLQQTFHCCGVRGPRDYPDANRPIPNSCKSPVDDTRFDRGCGPAVTDWIDSFGKIIGWVGIGIAIVEMTGVVLACMLTRNIGRKRGV